MQTWLRISLLLCTFGFFREMRPSEPFVAEYLSDSRHNITVEEINKEIYPFGTYAVLAQLVIVFLVTDILRYKPIIIVSSLAGIILFSLLLWAFTIPELQIAQIFYGTFMASEVAYYTYIYAKVEKSRYQIVTGHTRSAILSGKFLGGVLAQVLISTDCMGYRGLHIISLGSQVISFFVALALPSVTKSIYFYTDAVLGDVKSFPGDLSSDDQTLPQTTSSSSVITTSVEPKISWQNAFNLLLRHTVNAYTNPTVIQWSLWWSLATCGQLLVISYVQILWKEIDPNHENFYNGAVEAIVTLLGVVGAMAAGFLNSNQHKSKYMWILTGCSLLMGTFLIVSAITDLIWVSYLMYILFGMFYFFVITIAGATIAQNLSDDSFGLIFGINTLVALALQSILTVILITDTVFGLGPRQQYIAYGVYFVILAIGFFIAVVLKLIIRKLRTSKVVEEF